MKRRSFLKYALATPLLTTPMANWAAPPRKKVLFLGGTRYFGPVAVQALIEAGHEVVLTNRGITNPHLFPKLRWIYCDRETHDQSGLRNLANLVKEEHFDWVVDTWQKHPAAVLETTQLFKDKISHYQYVSTFSSYLEWDSVGIDETFPLNHVSELSYDWSANHRYALRKTMAELALMEHYSDNYSIFRSHGMRGFRVLEPTDVAYWPLRVLRGGDILVPGDGTHYVQVTDTVSLADFMVYSGERDMSGVYNVAYPPTRFKDYLNSIMRVTGTNPNFHWVPLGDLELYGIEPYRELAFWRPNRAGAYRFKVEKALGAGLKNRPFEKLIRDQLDSYHTRFPGGNYRFGRYSDALKAEREKEIIEDWLSRQNAMAG